MSKTIATAFGFGEDRTRAWLLLRAWMLWRARYVPGWVDGTKARRRLFDEEAERLYDDIRRLQPQKDGLLGNLEASSWLSEWVPDIVGRLRPLG